MRAKQEKTWIEPNKFNLVSQGVDLDGSNQHMWRGQNNCDMHDGQKTGGELMTNHGTFGHSKH